jgi:hypothetical protein
MIQKYNGHVRQQIRELLKTCSLDDISQIAEDLKLRRTYLHNMAIRQLRRGNKVKFFSRGSYHQGTVYKVAQKYVTVDTGSSYWKVPAGHLEKVA